MHPLRNRALRLLPLLLFPACAPWPELRQPPTTVDLWREQLRDKGVDPSHVPYPLDSTEAMRNMAHGLAGDGEASEKLRRLQQALFDARAFSFTYDARATHTASEAFARRRGNCVSFTNLFIAMARSIGIPVKAAILLHAREVEQIGDLVLVNTHVIAVYPRGNDVLLYDFARSRVGPPVGIRIVDDSRLTAICLNNWGVTALSEGDLGRARRRFEEAVALAGDFAEALGNLGVAHRRLGDVASALDAYLLALRYRPGNSSIKANIASLYRLRAGEDRAQPAVDAADAAALVVAGDLQMARQAPSSALKLYRLARKENPSSSLPPVAEARALVYLGRLRKAREALRAARAADPGNAEAARLLDLLTHTPDEPAPERRIRVSY